MVLLRASLKLARMSRNYKIRDQEQLYFVSFATTNWIDVFVRTAYKEVLTDSLKFCINEKGLEVMLGAL